MIYDLAGPYIISCLIFWLGFTVICLEYKDVIDSLESAKHKEIAECIKLICISFIPLLNVWCGVQFLLSNEIREELNKKYR